MPPLPNRTIRHSGPLTAIIAAGDDKEIPYAHHRGTTTLARCLREVGFAVLIVPSIGKLAAINPRNLPDLLVVDMASGEELIEELGEILIAMPLPLHMTIILYSYPDPSLIKTRRFFKNTYYLGDTFTDCDVFAIAGSAVTKRPGTQEIPALEGKIEGESLMEVMQLLEMGRKTGCLLISHDEPFGIVYICEGVITFASTVDYRGKDALLEMLALPRGYFRFAIDKKHSQKNCRITVSEMLMQWARIIDETSNLDPLIRSQSPEVFR